MFTSSSRDATLVASALGLLERHLRSSGARLPESLRVPVVHAYDAGKRQETTPVGDAAEVPDDARVALLLSYREAAGWLNTSERTVQRLVTSGALATKRIGRRSYITPADVERFVAELPENRTTR